MKNIFMIVHGIDVGKGGGTTAMLNRSTMFYEGGVNADIVTFDYKPNYDEIRNSLISQGKMDSRTKIYNAFEYYNNKSLSKKFKQNNKLYKDLKLTFMNAIEIKENKSISKYFDKYSGEYLAYKRKGKDNITVIDLFTNNKRVERLNFKDGLIHKKEIFNEKNNLSFEIFYNSKSFPFISRKINPETGSVGRTFLLNEQIEFQRHLDFCIYFLDDLIKDNPKNIMICDGPGSFPRMLKSHHKNAKKFSVIHSNHHKIFGNPGEKKQKQDYIIKNADNIDGVIVLTERQKNDIKSEYNVNNIFAISNSINFPDKQTDKQNNKIVGHISRLTPTKGLTYLIDVAEKVVNQDEDVSFEIYGVGPEENKIKELIKSKGLDKNIKLLGYTSQPNEVLKNFTCLLSTSQYEGQGLSMIEAMVSEVPVIAFDIKYGPSDFIINNKNGYLINNLDIEEMANKILKVINDNDLAKNLGENARNTILKKYSSDKILQEWKSLFK